jgi:hypothetical protein
LYTHPQDFYTNPEAEDSGEDSDDESNVNPDESAGNSHPLADFKAFARRRPLDDFTRIDLLEGLGTRVIDRNYDWSPHVGRYDISPEIWDQIKAQNLVTQVVIIDPSPLPLNLEQRKLYNIVVSQYSRELALQSPLPS